MSDGYRVHTRKTLLFNTLPFSFSSSKAIEHICHVGYKFVLNAISIQKNSDCFIAVKHTHTKMKQFYIMHVYAKLI